jgi:TatD DNase family protein
MPYIDIGANLTNSRFNTCLDDVLEDAKKWYVEKIILTGTNLKTTINSKNMVSKYPQYQLYYTSGVHPHDIKNFNNTDFLKIEEYAKDLKCVAIGECGLDYDRMFSPKDKQLYWFEEQIKLAIKLNKPLFLHEREAFEDFYNIISKYKGKVNMVVHCFTGNYSNLIKYLELGCYIGITGWICDDRRNSDLINALQKLDHKYLDRIMIETDSPFLSPIKDDKLCVPSYIYYVLVRLSKEFKIEEKKLETILYNNSIIFFNLK